MQFLYRKVSAVIGEHSFKVHIVEAFHVVFTNVLKAPAGQGCQLKNIFLKKNLMLERPPKSFWNGPYQIVSLSGVDHKSL